MVATEMGRGRSRTHVKRTGLGRKKVFICSPFAPQGETEKEQMEELSQNVALAHHACLFAVQEGCIPYAPHLYFTQFLDDDDEAERVCGQVQGLSWLRECDELWVIGRRISSGMSRELDKAREWDIPIRFYVMERTPEERILDRLFNPGMKINDMTIKGGN